MSESTEELEPLFDYSRVQPFDPACLDDEDSSPVFLSKRRKLSVAVKEPINGKGLCIVDCEDNEEEDWLPPPSKISIDTQNRIEDSTLKELRLKKQELLSCAQSAENAMRTFEESGKRDLSASLQFSLDSVAEPQSKPASNPPSERAKIIISIQDKDGLKNFRVYMDDKFERLFKIYADKVKLDMQNLTFCFDGDKISPTATPVDLGMEDNDIIEVHVKSS